MNIVVTVTFINALSAKAGGKLTDTARIAGEYTGDAAKFPAPVKWEGATFAGENGQGNGGAFGTATANNVDNMGMYDASSGAQQDAQQTIQSMRGTLTFTWDKTKQKAGNNLEFGNQFPKSIGVEVTP